MFISSFHKNLIQLFFDSIRLSIHLRAAIKLYFKIEKHLILVTLSIFEDQNIFKHFKEIIFNLKKTEQYSNVEHLGSQQNGKK